MGAARGGRSGSGRGPPRPPGPRPARAGARGAPGRPAADRKARGSWYPCALPASRTPKWTWGCAAERLPVVPTAPIRVPAATRCPALDRERREVQVGEVEAAVGGADADRESRRAGRAGEADRAGGGGDHGRPDGPGDVDPAMLARRVRVGAVQVGRDHLAVAPATSTRASAGDAARQDRQEGERRGGEESSGHDDEARPATAGRGREAAVRCAFFTDRRASGAETSPRVPSGNAPRGPIP